MCIRDRYLALHIKCPLYALLCTIKYARGITSVSYTHLRGITPHSDIQYVESRVIFKSNLEYYKGEKDNESIYG